MIGNQTEIIAQQPKFVFTPAEAESKGVFDTQDLPKLIKDAMNLAQAPISGVNVGVVGSGSSGRIFLGVNVEFPYLPLHYSILSEQFLVTNLALKYETDLRFLAISTTKGSVKPSGHCLQFLQEISDAHKIQVLLSDQNAEDGASIVSLERFLPYGSVERDDTILLEQRNDRLALSDPDNVGDICSNPEDCHHLKCWALSAANQSYVPYSDCPSGVALVDNDKRVYRGWYIESASYNLGVGPVQAALVDFMVYGEGKEFDEIVGAVLVEKKDAMVRQEDTARLILKTIAAPNCTFNVFHCN